MGKKNIGNAQTSKGSTLDNVSGVRLYHLVRDEDVSGVSGTGVVAEVCEFSNGWVAVGFLLSTAGIPNLINYGSIEDVEKIHGHGGKTRLVRKADYYLETLPSRRESNG